MSLSDQNIDALADRVADRILSEKRARWVDPETHEEHHRWILEKINTEHQRNEMRRRIIESSIAWAMPIALGFLAVAVWQYIKLQVVR